MHSAWKTKVAVLLFASTAFACSEETEGNASELGGAIERTAESAAEDLARGTEHVGREVVEEVEELDHAVERDNPDVDESVRDPHETEHVSR